MAVTMCVRTVEPEPHVVYLQDVATARQLYERAYVMFGCRPLRILHLGAVLPATQDPILAVAAAGSATMVHAVFVSLARATYPDAAVAAAANWDT
jgi:hypothetical protein